MDKNPIQAKNVVSFGGGNRITRPTDPFQSDSAAAEAEALIDAVEEKASAPAEAKPPEVKPATPAKPTGKVKKVSAVETKPLKMRTSRFVDEEPQEPDWADELEEIQEQDEHELSTFAEVVIPLHGDSPATIVRKGMVIVSLIIILVSIVAIVMNLGAISGVITPAFSATVDSVAVPAVVSHFIL